MYPIFKRTVKQFSNNVQAVNEMKERSLLLDMYRTVTKETRDKVALMASEKKVGRTFLKECIMLYNSFGRH